MPDDEKNLELRDLPCLYFVSAFGDRGDMARVYYYVAQWCGYSLKAAAKASSFHSTVLGLFGGKSFTEDELRDYKDDKTGDIGSKACALVQYMNCAKEHGLVQKCCSVCEYSYQYKNSNMDFERMLLKRMTENPELIPGCDSGKFKYMYCGHGTKDVLSCPPYPIHRLFARHIRSEKRLDAKDKKLINRVKKWLLDNYGVVNDDYVNESVATTVRCIMDQAVSVNDETLLATVNRPKPYSPSVIVLPSVPKPDKNGFVQPVFFDSKYEIEERAIKIQDETREELGLAYENYQQAQKRVGKHNEEPSPADTEPVAEAGGQSSEPVPAEEVEKDLAQSDVVQDAPVLNESITESIAEANEPEVADAPEDAELSSESAVADSTEECPSSAEESAGNISESFEIPFERSAVEESLAGAGIDGAEPSDESNLQDEPSGNETASDPDNEEREQLTVVPSECLDVAPKKSLLISGGGDNTDSGDAVCSDVQNHDTCPETASAEQVVCQAGEPVADECLPEAESVQEETETCATYEASAQNEPIPSDITGDEADAAPIADDVANASEQEKEHDNASPSPVLPLEITLPCEVCGFGNNINLASSLLNDKKRGFLNAMQGEASELGNNYFDLRSVLGCGLARKSTCDSRCVYCEPNAVSQNFEPFVLESSDGCKEVFYDFLTDFAKAKEVSVDFVTYRSIEGLLFYLSGKFYFFNPAYGYSGYLKTVLSKTENRPMYCSANPIPVYASLYKLGVYDLTIESVCALYSVARGSYALAPTSVVFGKYVRTPVLFDDFYANAMPKYGDVVKDYLPVLTQKQKTRYTEGRALEKALARNTETGEITSVEKNLFGGNFLQYGFELAKSKDIGSMFRRVGTLLQVSLSEQDRFWSEDFLLVKRYFSRLCSDVYFSMSKFLDAAHMIFLSDKTIVFFVTDDVNAFYDHLLSIARDDFRELLPGNPCINIQRIDYRESKI